MEFTQDSPEASSARRKPRSRTKKAPPEGDFQPAARIPAEIDSLMQAGEILEETPPKTGSGESGWGSRWDFGLPVIGIAFVLFLLSQILALRQNAASMTWRIRNLDLQAESLKSVRNNSAALFQKRQILVKDSQRVSENYNALLVDLLKLAETDRDARAVVEKFNIKSGAPGQPPTSAK